LIDFLYIQEKRSATFSMEDIDIDAIWTSTCMNFQNCTEEQPVSSPTPQGGDIDTDAIWKESMDNFNECTNQDGGSAASSPANPSPAHSSPVHSRSSPSSSSYAPTPPRRQHRQQAVARGEVVAVEDEDGETEQYWEESEGLGMALCFPIIPDALIVCELINTAIRLAAPVYWTGAMDDLHTLRPRTMIYHRCMEFYMLWFTLGQLSRNEMWYVPMDITSDVLRANTLDEEQIDTFRSQMAVTLPATWKPVVTICHHSDHFFVVVLDYQTSSLYMLGRNIRVNLGRSVCDISDLKDWNGCHVWSQISRLFDWDDLGAINPTVVQTVNWQQVMSL
jgi:hypothetical protein